MADYYVINNWPPKGVVGKMGRENTDRPNALKLKAAKPQINESVSKRRSSSSGSR